MCYTVLVIEKSCHRSHPTRITACWRQCDRRAADSAAKGKWNNLCANRAMPQIMELMTQITAPGHMNPPDMQTLCKACSRLEGDDKGRGIKAKIDEDKAIEAGYRNGLNDLSAQMRHAQLTKTGRALAAEMDDLHKHYSLNQLRREQCVERLNRNQYEYNRISKAFGAQTTSDLCQEAFYNLNLQPKIYMAVAQADEIRHHPFYPRHRWASADNIYYASRIDSI